MKRKESSAMSRCQCRVLGEDRQAQKHAEGSACCRGYLERKGNGRYSLCPCGYTAVHLMRMLVILDSSFGARVGWRVEGGKYRFCFPLCVAWFFLCRPKLAARGIYEENTSIWPAELGRRWLHPLPKCEISLRSLRILRFPASKAKTLFHCWFMCSKSQKRLPIQLRDYLHGLPPPLSRVPGFMIPILSQWSDSIPPC
jgi:hypothetical protein